VSSLALPLTYDVAFGFTNLAPIIAAISIKNNTTNPPHIPASVNDAASPFKPTSLDFIGNKPKT